MTPFFTKIFVLLIIIAVFCLLIFLDFQGRLGISKNIVYKIFAPAQKFFYSQSRNVSDFLRFIFSSNSLIQENRLLKEDSEKLKIENLALEEEKRKNEIIKTELNSDIWQKNRPADKKFIAADVLGRDPLNFGQYFLIDKGEKDGLALNLVVTKAGGILVGKISEIYPSYSKVLLITDANSLVNVVSQKNRASGLLKGKNGVLFLEMIPQTDRIEQEEIILTSGAGNIFPSGLIVGEVEKIFATDADVFQKAEIKPTFNEKDLEIVFVISE